MPRKGFTRKIINAIRQQSKPAVLALLVTITIVGAVVGYKYYKHTQEDPQFCASCHLMREAFLAWQKGKHRDVVCQRCHHLSLLEQNQLLVAFVVKGSTQFSQTHGRIKPWQGCKECHLDEVAQGALTLRKSYGHARHVFMQNIGCKSCHSESLHLFKPDGRACQDCHKDKGVHGIGMEGFACLNCHSYSEKTPAMVPKERCLKCHNIAVRGPMSEFQCHQCHKPHVKIKPSSKDCLSQCHGNEATVGQHGLHINKGMECLDCHKAHSWIVGQKESRRLCSRCHKAKDPMAFIY